MRTLLIYMSLFLFSFSFAPSTALAQKRPPQFVMLAFDGSKSAQMWDETLRFANELNERDIPLRFTYFISGVYYLNEANKKMYQAPGYKAGASNIGWGKDAADLLTRYNYTNSAHINGHEIASHAVGHFDGSTWTAEEWTTEFNAFDGLIFSFFQNNRLLPTTEFPNGWLFRSEDIVGFRAPLLGHSPGLWETIKKFSYRYDTSLTSQPDYWPTQHAKGGHWNFPLAVLKIAGTGKKTLSMDYNFYVAQSGAKSDPENSSLYEQQMYETYINYFDSNYYGNRAPLHIGHHFSLWNGGAYWRAMKRFATKVCGMPDVQCATYKELADYMDKNANSEVANYRLLSLRGTKRAVLHKTYDLDGHLKIKLTSNNDNIVEILPELSGADAEDVIKQNRLELYIDGELVSAFNNQPIKQNLNRLRKKEKIAFRILNKKNQELFSRTYLTGVLLNAVARHKSLVGLSIEDQAMHGDLPAAHSDE